MQILFTGETLTADTALQWGLVNQVVAQSDLPIKAANLITILDQNAPLSLKAAKKNVQSTWSILDDEEDLAQQCCFSDDYQEGIRAFLEKRKPNFKER